MAYIYIVKLFFFITKVFYAVIDNVLSANNSKSWTKVNEKVNVYTNRIKLIKHIK